MNEISPKLVFNAVIRKIWIVILCAVIGGGLAFFYFSSFVEPTYQADTAIIVDNGALTNSETVTSQNLAASANMLVTCTDILKTAKAYKLLSSELGHPESDYTDYQNMTTVSVRSEDSLIIDINARSKDKNAAAEVAQTYAELAPDYIKSVFPSANVAIVESCTADEARQVSPHVLLLTLTMAFVGIIASVAVIAIRAISDTTVKGENDLADKYNVVLLGAVPDFDLVSK